MQAVTNFPAVPSKRSLSSSGLTAQPQQELHLADLEYQHVTSEWDDDLLVRSSASQGHFSLLKMYLPFLGVDCLLHSVANCELLHINSGCNDDIGNAANEGHPVISV